MFTAALFTIAKTRNNPKCPLTEEWIKKMSKGSHQKIIIIIMPFAATWMDPEILRLSEVSQKEKDKYHVLSLICGI